MGFSGNNYLYMISSFIGNLGTILLMLALFKIEMKKKSIVPMLVVTFVVSLVSLVILHGDGYAKYIPIVWLVLTVLFLVRVHDVRLGWSLIVAIVGALIGQVIGGILVVLPGGFFSTHALQEHIWRNYVVDIFSGVVSCGFALLLRRLEIGFSFEFKKIQLWESIVVFVGITTSMCLMVVIIGSLHLAWVAFAGLVLFLVALILFLSYSTTEELRQNSIIRSSMWWLKDDTRKKEVH